MPDCFTVNLLARNSNTKTEYRKLQTIKSGGLVQREIERFRFFLSRNPFLVPDKPPTSATTTRPVPVDINPNEKYLVDCDNKHFTPGMVSGSQRP